MATNNKFNIFYEGVIRLFKDMQFIAKSALIKEQIDDRISRGVTNIEIQLRNEFCENKEIDLNLINEVDVSVVHMPLYKGEDFPIEHKEGRDYFKQTCELANKVGHLKGHDIIVVVHIATATSELIKTGLMDIIKSTILDELNKYDNIVIALENPPAFSYRRHDHFIFNSALSIKDDKILFSNVELAKYINHERCGVCLDVCHALMDEHNLSWIDSYFNFSLSDCMDKNNRLLNEFFLQCKPYINLIHLSYTEYHGFEKYHGFPYVDEDFDRKCIRTLKHVERLYTTLEYNCPVTLEIYENNIQYAENYSKTIDTIKNL